MYRGSQRGSLTERIWFIRGKVFIHMFEKTLKTWLVGELEFGMKISHKNHPGCHWMEERYKKFEAGTRISHR
jgi:hypothetical protein